MRQWVCVPVNLDPNVKVPSNPKSYIVDEIGNIIASTYDNDRKITRMLTMAHEMYDLINIILECDSNLDSGLYKELDAIIDFIDDDINNVKPFDK